MTTIPPEAIAAAAEAIHEHVCSAYRDHNEARDYQQARAALEAAAPLLSAAERERACRIASSYLDGNVLREFTDEVAP